MSDNGNIPSLPPVVLEYDQGDIFSRIVSITEEARSTIIRTVKYKGRISCDLFTEPLMFSLQGEV